jgi:ankyrin repeat protein
VLLDNDVTNLDFVELLLESGADTNAKDHNEMTPLMYTNDLAPGAAKFLLNWPTTEINILNGAGESFLVILCSTISSHDNPALVQHIILVQQWRDIEEMLIERGQTSQRLSKTATYAIHFVLFTGE